MTSVLVLTNVFLIVSSSYIYKTSGDATISNVPCRNNHRCERHGYSYTWCYTDSRDNWDYCCDTPCAYDKTNALLCKSGSYVKFCGSPGIQTVFLETCVDWWPCGHHDYNYYWCYTDNEGKNWDYCCHPNASCTISKYYGANVCNIGLYRIRSNYWAGCKAIS
ncbi:hypothetical protein ACJMK2_022447 [Sinanodonta woodiana]|uniref:Uncharacterized protein n=1 Tax=Sinanodonta woodiana TaxID=1069815 RepID=A0ABD3TK44_SINWO